MLLSASDDRTVRLWRLNGDLITTLTGHSGGVRFISVSPPGDLIATGSRDGTFKLWSATGKLLTTQRVSHEQVRRVCFSPIDATSSQENGPLLATTADDGMLTLWRLDSFDDQLLDRLVTRGCAWAKDYLKTNSHVSESDRALGTVAAPAKKYNADLLGKKK